MRSGPGSPWQGDPAAPRSAGAGVSYTSRAPISARGRSGLRRDLANDVRLLHRPPPDVGEAEEVERRGIIANNIANLNTTAYRGERALFQEYLVPTSDNQEISFVQDIGLIRDLAEAEMVQTGNPLDVAINGKGLAPLTSIGCPYVKSGPIETSPWPNTPNRVTVSAAQKVLTAAK